MDGLKPAIGSVLLLGLLLVSTGAALASAPASVAAATAAGSAAIPTVSSPPALPVSPAVSDPPQEIPVGGGPDAVAIDTANGTAFVANQYSNNVTEISLATNQVLMSVPVGVQPAPGALAVDPANGTAYVANSGSNNVSAISLSLGGVSASIPVGSVPDALVFDSANNEVYVADSGSGTVSVISTATNRVVATIPVGPDPNALVVDTVNHNVFVADGGAGNVSVISALTNLVIATVTVGSDPGGVGGLAFDSVGNLVFVQNIGSNNVTIIGGTNHTAFANVPVGSGPSGIAVDPTRKEAFVANRFSNNVSVISTVTGGVVKSIPVGQQPGTNGAIAFGTTTGDIYVANGGSNNLTVISAATNTTVGTIATLNIPDAVAPNPANGAVYVADQGASNVTVFTLTSVTFEAVGLPAGSAWSVTAGSPAVARTNTTFRTLGKIGFVELSGVLTYSIGAPAGYGVSTVTGPRFPTQTSANLTNLPTTLVVAFGKTETLYFNETGLPAGARWGIVLTSAALHGGGPRQLKNTTTASLSFSVVQGSWRFHVTPKPSTYRAIPPSGVQPVPAHPIGRAIRFLPLEAAVVFRESGLPRGMSWQVNVTGPMNLTKSGLAADFVFYLINGTYSYKVWNFSASHPHPESGTFTVVVPHAAITIPILYNSSAAVPRSGPWNGAFVLAGPAMGAKLPALPRITSG